MQKIEYKESPSPHVIIDNFLPTKAAKKCLEEAQALEPIYEDARTAAADEMTDGCEECVALEATVKNMVRSNKVVYLDKHYNNNRYNSMLLSSLKVAISEPTFVAAMSGFPRMFPIVAHTTHMETILSSYGQCDFFGWHKDSNPSYGNNRIISLVLHLNTEPQEYVGGELVLAGNNMAQDQLAYTPKHNRAILFQSNQCLHAVDETNHEGDFKDSRFSINLWMGFPDGTDIVSSFPYK